MLAIIDAIEDDSDRELLTEWYQEFYRIMRKKSYDIIGDYHLANDSTYETWKNSLLANTYDPSL